jgi:hypothetical protein
MILYLNSKESSKKQISQLNQLQTQPNNLQHNESFEKDHDHNQINARQYSQSINEHKQFNQELQHICERRHPEQPNIKGGRGKPFEVVVNAQNVVKEVND